MVEPIENVNRTLPREGLLRKPGDNPQGRPRIESDNVAPGIDSVDFHSESLQETLRRQAGVLKEELPGLIADAVLASPEDSATRQEPLNEVLFRLESPLDSILGRLPQEEIPDSLVLGLQEELARLRNELPALKGREPLQRFEGDAGRQAALDELFSSLNQELDGLSARLARFR